MKIAIVGTGIAGLSAAWLLHKHHELTIYERHRIIGGHVDTFQHEGFPPLENGFMIFNDRYYPNFTKLLETLKVETDPANVTFAGSLHGKHIEYSDSNIFGRVKNKINPRFLLMAKDMGRITGKAEAYLESKEPNMPLGLWLKKKGFSKGFAQDCLLPLGRALWHLPPSELKQFPARNFFRQLKIHGLLDKKNAPQWRSIRGGARSYIEKLAAPFADKIVTDNGAVTIYRRKNGVEITDKFGETKMFDVLILACHPDQSLRLLHDAKPAEQEVLEAFPYVQNKAVLHTDKNLMPGNKQLWSGWNFLSKSNRGPSCVTFWMNKIFQSLENNKENFFLTVNPHDRPDNILHEASWFHPSFTGESLKAWKKLPALQGANRTFFCGAWCGYGLHEDALASGLSVAEAIGPAKRPWEVREISPAATHAHTAL